MSEQELGSSAETQSNETAQESQTTEAVSQPSANTGGTAPEAAASAQVAQPSTPTYTPDWKYKAAGEEREIEEWLRPAITDSEREKKIKDYLARAYGFDVIRNKYSEVKKGYDDTTKYVTTLENNIRSLGDHIKAKDYGSFFDALGVKKEDIYNWVVEQAKYQQMPFEQRAELDRQRQEARRSIELENQNAELMQKVTQASVQAREMELQSALTSPEVAQYAQAFDAKLGKVGAFREEVIRAGQLAFTTQKRDLSASEAVGEVMSRIKPFLAVTPQAAQQTVVPQDPVGQQAAKPIIPNIASKGVSPAKKLPRSLDDLRKIQAAMD